MPEKIIILHQEVKGRARKDEQDTLAQAAYIAETIRSIGLNPVLLPISLDLNRARSLVRGRKPDIVFNLVESLGGRGEFIHFAAGILESLGVPFTGASSRSLFQTSHKILAKEIMRRSGLPTPDWFTVGDFLAGRARPFFPCIRKHVWEHASIGMDDTAVIADEAALRAKLEKPDGSFFFERFVEGREFNIALLEEKGRPRALSPVEIDFVGYPAGKPRIIGYKAKWKNGTFEYVNTRNRFDFPPEDAPLLTSLTEIALRSWEAFALSGYARVDFRVDGEGKPWVLEINANPCLTPDAGFYKTAERSGFSSESLIRTILENARKGY